MAGQCEHEGNVLILGEHGKWFVGQHFAICNLQHHAHFPRPPVRYPTVLSEAAIVVSLRGRPPLESGEKTPG